MLSLPKHFFKLNYLRNPFSKRHQTEWTSNRVRQTFVDYFKSHGYAMVPSSSVVPVDDRSIYFVNSGMIQFKPIFLGTLSPSDPRREYRLVVNSQKCVRAGGKHNDLAEVGRDGTHHTFFEMLGNWAFNGRLSKMDACRQAMNLLVDVYGLPKDRLFVTYFKGDDSLGLPPDLECRDVWLELGFRSDRIVGLGMDDNFWEMSADDGPCGPCTEIMYSSCDPPSFDQSMELWNVVFMSYDKRPDGLRPLPAMHIDTGMGLERLCCVLQNVKTTYETDLFQPLLKRIQELTGAPPYAGLFGDLDANEIDTSYRILADHTRMFTIAVSDGMVPTATSAGGILRRIIRNAAYQASFMRTKIHRKQRRKKLELSNLCDVVAESLGGAYPELTSNLNRVKQSISHQQATFENLLQNGKREFGKFLRARREISPTELLVFREKDGLPLDVLRLMLKEKNVQYDAQELERIMADQKDNQLERLSKKKLITAAQEQSL